MVEETTLSLDPQQLCKKPGVVVYAHNLSSGEKRMEPGAHWPASLAESVNPYSVKIPVSKNKVRSNRER